MSAQNPNPAGDPALVGPAGPGARPDGVVRPGAGVRRGADRPAGGDQRARPPRCGRRSTTPRSRTSRSRRPRTSPRRSPAPARPRSRGRARPLAARAAMLLRLHDIVLDRQDEITDLVVWENGKARKHAFDEPLHVALTARYYGRTAQPPPRHPAQPGRLPGADPGRDQPGAQGRRRDHLAVELPLQPRAHRRPRRDRRRQRRRHQAGRPDDAVGPARRRAARGGRLPEGHLAGRRRSRRRRSAARSSSAPTTSASPAPPPPAGSSRRRAPTG